MNTSKHLINGMTVDELLAFHRENFGDARMEGDDDGDDSLTAAAATAEAGTVPADLTSIEDPDELQALIDSLTAEFDTQYEAGSRDIPKLTAIADDLDRVRAEQATRAQAAAEADAAAAALVDRIRPAIDAAQAVEDAAAAGGADPETPADPTDPVDPAAPVDPVEPDPVNQAVAPAAAPAAVQAAAAPRRAAPAAVANRAPRPAPARGGQRANALVAGAGSTAPRASLIAALDFASSQYPELTPNTEVTLLQIAASMQERAASMPVGKNRPRIGRLLMPFAQDRTMTSDPQHNAQVLRAYAEPVSAPALVAAGGFCAPSTPVFEMFDLGPDQDNLFDVPTFGGDVRAGILFPSFFSVGDADDAYWSWSETADINAVAGVAFTGSITSNVATLNFADEHGLEVGSSIRLTGATASGMPDGDYVVATVVDADTITVVTDAADDASISGTGTPFKHCMRIPCPTWSECRMGADGLCITHGNLSNEAWPELTADFLRIALSSHRRYMSSRRIARVVNDTVTVAPTALTSDATGDYLAHIELQAADMRSQYRVNKSRVIDALIPDWLLPVLRANLATRVGVENFMNVTDAQITGWLTARGIRPQFTPDWQPLYSGTPAIAYPSTVTTAMWFSGSYFSLNGARIDLGVQRDPEMNASNDYTAAWFEEFWTICRRGPQGRKFAMTLTAKMLDALIRETATNA